MSKERWEFSWNLYSPYLEAKKKDPKVTIAKPIQKSPPTLEQMMADSKIIMKLGQALKSSYIEKLVWEVKEVINGQVKKKGYDYDKKKCECLGKDEKGKNIWGDVKDLEVVGTDENGPIHEYVKPAAVIGENGGWIYSRPEDPFDFKFRFVRFTQRGWDRINLDNPLPICEGEENIESTDELEANQGTTDKDKEKKLTSFRVVGTFHTHPLRETIAQKPSEKGDLGMGDKVPDKEGQYCYDVPGLMINAWGKIHGYGPIIRRESYCKLCSQGRDCYTNKDCDITTYCKIIEDCEKGWDGGWVYPGMQRCF